MTPQRPQFPANARAGSPCPTCGALVPESTFDGCPKWLAWVEQQKTIQRDRRRIWGLGGDPNA